jgi:CelD/BcsL family acetyltransferase involved in cellulose biosynthesis
VRAASRLDVWGIRDGGAFAGLCGEWGALMTESQAALFNAWEWLYPWFRRISPAVEPSILLVRNAEDALVGLLPLALSSVRVGPWRLRRLGFLGETHVGSDGLGVVAQTGLEQPVSFALARALCDAQREWDVLDFNDVEQGSPWVSALQEVFSEPKWRVEVRPRFVCPYELLDPAEGFDNFLRRTARRDNYLRRRKWLARQEGYALTRTDQPAGLARPLGEFFQLHEQRWAAEGGSQGIKGPGVEAFHRDAAYLFAERGQLRLYTLYLAGRAVASVYGLRHRDRFLYYQSGYNPAWRDRSVGLVLVGETFRDAFAEGCRRYDFLRGTEPYKSDWVTRTEHTVAVRVFRARGRQAWLSRQEAAAKGLRDGIKALLPAAWTERIRRARRHRARI